MYIQLDFCSLRFVSPTVCVVAVSANQHVSRENAQALLEILKERTPGPIFLIIDRSASYTYDPNAIQFLKDSGHFEQICVVVNNIAQRRLALYENLISGSDLKIFTSLNACLLYCHELVQGIEQGTTSRTP